MSPTPTLTVLCPSQLLIQWEIPYSNENFPVENYTIQAVNASSGASLINITQQSNTSHLLTLDKRDQVSSCDLLIFNVSAVSTAGASLPGSVSGGFPIGKKYKAIHVYRSSYHRQLDIPLVISTRVHFYCCIMI